MGESTWLGRRRVNRTAACLLIATMAWTTPVPGAEPSANDQIPGNLPDALEEAFRLMESVEVRLVLFDVLVVDRDGRSVSGLSREDFTVLVDGHETPIDTFDADCPAGGAAEPLPLHRIEKAALAASPIASDPGRTLVLAIDYQHLRGKDRTKAIEWASRAVKERASPADRVMVVALGNTLRVEQDLSADHPRVLAALDRMKRDVSLYAGDFTHTSDRPYLQMLTTVMDLLEPLPGGKAVVLFSELGGLKKETDRDLDELGARAATSRVALYPIEVTGEGEAAGDPGG